MQESAHAPERIEATVAGNRRNLGGKTFITIGVIAALMSVYHMYALYIGYITPMIHRSFHILFVVLLVFLSYRFRAKPSTGKEEKIPLVDILLGLLGVACCLYVVFDYNELIYRSAEPTTTDIFFSTILVILVLEAGRRTMGAVLPLIALVALFYAYFGCYIPGMLGHRGYDLCRITSIEFMTMEGVFGLPTGVSATMVYMFILFGAFLMTSGGGAVLTDTAFSVAGRMTGGPAKVAIAASAIFGTVSGSAVANVATTGQFTIPLMKRMGYKSHFAGAISAVASSWGVCTPPIMGAGAFIMAELLEIPYFSVVKAAIVPCVLTYLSLFVTTHYESLKLGLKGQPAHQLPHFLETLRRGYHVLFPLVVLFVLVMSNYPVMNAALVSILSILGFSLLKRSTRFTIPKLYSALRDGALTMLEVACACACAGIVIGVINLTGLGLKFASFVVSFSQGNVYLVLFLTMIVLLILGMGLPATASYLIGVAVAGPALIQIGIEPLPAHLFIFYFAAISSMTPPIALAAYVGAGIAGSRPLTTGFTACWLGLASFVIPYMFVQHQGLLLEGSLSAVIYACATAAIGVVYLGISISGFLFGRMSWMERLFMLAAGLLAIHPNVTTDILGVATGIAILIYHYVCRTEKTLGSP